MRGVIGMAGWLMMVALSACSAPDTTEAVRPADEAATARSLDGTFRYEARSERDAVWVHAGGDGEKVAEIPVDRAPVALTVGPDDTLYVANRGGRSVSVIARGRWKEAGRMEVGPEPLALAVAPDGNTLYVLHATSLENADRGRLVAVDLETRAIRWSLQVGRSPRSLTLDPDAGIAIIGFLEAEREVRVDLAHQRIIPRGTALAPNAQAVPGSRS